MCTVRDVLELPHLRGTEVLAGEEGLDRVVASVNVMENPDIVPWVKAHELLITVGYSVRGGDIDLEQLLEQLADRELAAFGIKLGRYIMDLAPPVLQRADRLAFPVLALPASVSFDDVISDVYTEINSRFVGDIAGTSDLSQKLIDVALAGGSPRDVAERFAESVGCDVVFVSNLRDASHSWQADADRGPPVPAAERGSHFEGAVSAPIVAGSSFVGQLHAYASATVKGPQLQRLVSTCAQVMALSASREIAVAAIDRQFHTELMTSVLYGRLSPTEAERRCRGVDWELRFPAVVVTVVPIEQTTADAAELQRFQSMMAHWLRGRQARPPFAMVDGAMVAVVGCVDGTVTTMGTELQQHVLAARRWSGSWSGGVSAPVDTAEQLHKAWSQAAMAARVGAAVHGVGTATMFADIGAYRLLSEIDRDMLRAYALDTLGAVLSSSSHTELKRTLAVLLSTNLNVAETARRLHYHYNTVRYRIEQLERLLGPFQNDAARCLELRLAILICEMAGIGLDDSWRHDSDR